LVLSAVLATSYFEPNKSPEPLKLRVAGAAVANPMMIVKLPFLLTAAFTLSLVLAGHTQLKAAEVAPSPTVREYASVRFMGDESGIVWPDGNVTKVQTQSGLKKPKEADNRMFWLTISMNIMSKKGFEFLHAAGPDVVMSRIASSEIARYEYASVRFMEENTGIVWPDGSVMKVVPESGLKRPKDADYRIFWLTVSMNMMSKRGFEFLYMDDADVIMRRSLSK